MAGVDGVRKRGKRNTAPLQKAEKDGNASEGPSLCRLIIFAGLLAIVVSASYLCFAYVTSPITSVVVDDMHDVRQLKWANVHNDNLQRGRKVLTELTGPESVVVDKDGNWYTGLADGRIVKITNAGKHDQSIVDITRSFNFAQGSKRTGKRPLGLRLVNTNLYFVDAFQGVFVIDIQSEKWEKIIGYDDVNPHMAFPDDLTITADGKTIYFTDVSERWNYSNVGYCVVEGECSGRVFKIDVGTKQVEMIYRGLCFANGIELDRTETKLLASENSRRRVAVIDLKSRSIVKNILLPGGPDNIRRSTNGGYWVAVPSLHDPIGDFIFKYPALRDVLAGVLGEKGLYKLANLEQGIAVKLDEKFEPESIHFDLEGKVSKAITEISELGNGVLLLGSFIAKGIVKLDGIGK